MEVKEEMAKFRYNLNRFQSCMNDYEFVMGVANQMRAKRRLDEQNGLNPNKWDNFIVEKDAAADLKLSEAEEAYSALKQLLCSKAKVKPKA